MDQTSITADPRRTNPVPFRAALSACSRDPRWIRVDGGTFRFTSYAAVSAAYCATIGHLGLGMSEAPSCTLLDAAGDPVALVAYNGRIFAIGADGEPDYAVVLHETGS